MVLAGNLDVNSEHNYLSKTLKMNRTTNGEAEKGLRKQNDLVPRHSVDGRCGNSVIDGASARICFDEKCKETYVAGCSSSKPNVNKVRQHGEMTLQDMYEGQNLVDDDEDDSDWEPEEKHVEKRGARQHREVTLQDMHDNPNLFDDDDDSDSDWEPLEKHVEVKRWFCTNCTMLNFDDIVHCEICGEHKESGILRHGFFASPLLPNALLTDLELDIEEKHKDESAQNPAPSRRTAIGFDERMLLHSEVEMKSYPHPERPDRIQAIAASLATAGIFPGRCYPIAAREITREELHMVHSLEHVEAIEHSSKSIASYFTPDTYANEHSACAARLAAGLCADLASAVVSGRVKNGFALVRPPGHHAGVAQAMGFCLHNNAAVAALAAQAAGAKKVLIVDWDVHHGNGTQEIFDNNKSVLYISLHRHEGGKFYPGTGAADEVGTMGAEGYCVNVPWSRRGIGDNDYVFAFQHVVLPIASEFAPDLTIISAGFDAARGDPLGCCDVTPTGYAKMTEMLNDTSGGKLLVILEGGYNLRSISSSATAVIKVLLGESRECELENSLPSRSGLQTILDVLKIQMKYWPKLQPDFAKLQSQWEMFLLHNKSEGKKGGKIKKQHRRHRAPLLWKYGRKSMLYRLLNGNVHVKRKCACQFC